MWQASHLQMNILEHNVYLNKKQRIHASNKRSGILLDSGQQSENKKTFICNKGTTWLKT